MAREGLNHHTQARSTERLQSTGSQITKYIKKGPNEHETRWNTQSTSPALFSIVRPTLGTAESTLTIIIVAKVNRTFCRVLEHRERYNTHIDTKNKYSQTHSNHVCRQYGYPSSVIRHSQNSRALKVSTATRLDTDTIKIILDYNSFLSILHNLAMASYHSSRSWSLAH